MSFVLQEKMEMEYSYKNFKHQFQKFINTEYEYVNKLNKKFNKKIKEYKKARSKAKDGKYWHKIKKLSVKDFKKVLFVLLQEPKETVINIPMEKLSHKLDMPMELALEYICIAALIDLCDITSTNNGAYSKVNKKLLKKSNIKYSSINNIPPMVCKPNSIKSTGSPFITLDQSLILHEPDVKKSFDLVGESTIEVLDKLNAIPLKLKIRDFNEEEEYWKVVLKNYSKTERKVHRKFARDSRKIYQYYVNKPFWFTWVCDYRGRLYCNHRHINFQGDDYKRSIVRLSKKEPLTDRGMFWVEVNVANLWGQGIDKLPYPDRCLWARTKGLTVDWKEADKPFQFREMRDAMIENKPTDILASVDATTSSIQFLSIAARCHTSMRKCNILGNEMMDAPMEVLKRYKKLMKGKGGKIDRKTIKDTIMTQLYGSLKKPRETFKTKKKLKAYYKAVKKELPKISELVDVLFTLLDPNTETYAFDMPDGFKVRVKVYDKKKYRFRTDVLGFRITHYVTEHKPNKYYVGLVASLIHALDAYVMRKTILRCDFDVLPIHDSAFTHPNNLDKISKIYREELFNIYKNKTLVKILKKYFEVSIKLGKMKTTSFDNPYTLS